MMNKFETLELDQGVGYDNRVFGYDHERRNFVTWAVVDGELAIHSVDRDETEDDCGLLAETRAMAERFLARRGAKYDRLLAACLAGSERA